MKNVLFYGDSNTWGYQGDDPLHRLDADKRYTGVVASQFPDVHFIEEGLCGRTICNTDPVDYGRNGMDMLPALLATHDPIDVIVIMLGTNDSKAMYGHSSFTISEGMDRTESASVVEHHADAENPAGRTAANRRKPCKERLLRHV